MCWWQNKTKPLFRLNIFIIYLNPIESHIRMLYTLKYNKMKIWGRKIRRIKAQEKHYFLNAHNAKWIFLVWWLIEKKARLGLTIDTQKPKIELQSVVCRIWCWMIEEPAKHCATIETFRWSEHLVGYVLRDTDKRRETPIQASLGTPDQWKRKLDTGLKIRLS